MPYLALLAEVVVWADVVEDEAVQRRGLHLNHQRRSSWSFHAKVELAVVDGEDEELKQDWPLG